MPNFRLTNAISKKLNIDDLESPTDMKIHKFFDDWCINIARIKRKEILIFAHTESLIFHSIPIFEIGGIKNAFDCFPILIRDFLHAIDFDKYEKIGNQFYEHFHKTPSFYKFNNI